LEVDVVTLAAEFPNDNPALHCGASWICLDVTGAPVAVREERPPPVIAVVEAEVEAEPEVVMLVEPEPEVVMAVESEPEPEPEVPAARISCVVPAGQGVYLDDVDEHDDLIVVEELPPLDETASVEGASVVAAESSTLPAAPDDPFTILLAALTDVAIGAGSPHVASVLPALLFESRLAEGIPEDAARALAEANIALGTELTPTFLAQMSAWRAILLGTSDDFSACGSAMLDEWAAELVARLLGAPSRATALRRELRSRGVAAFGLVDVAA
jgi:hypothetical protein